MQQSVTKSRQSSSVRCHRLMQRHTRKQKKNRDGGGVNNITVNLSKHINHTHISDSLCALILLLPTIRRCFRKFLWVEKSKQRRDNRGQRKKQNVKKKGVERKEGGVGGKWRQGKTKRGEFSVRLLFLRKEVKKDIIRGKYAHFLVSVSGKHFPTQDRCGCNVPHSQSTSFHPFIV